MPICTRWCWAGSRRRASATAKGGAHGVDALVDADAEAHAQLLAKNGLAANVLFDHHGRQDQQPPYALEPRLELLSWSAIAAVAKEQGHDAARTRVQLEYEVQCAIYDTRR